MHHYLSTSAMTASLRDRRLLSPFSILHSQLCVFLFVLFLSPVAATAEVRAKIVHIPDSLKSGDVVEITLADYWRTNGQVTDEGLTDNKTDFPNVLNLIEYRIDAALGGQFELQAKYIVRESSLAQLRVNGDEIANLFDKPGDHSAEWTSLGKFGLRTGTNFLRFTSRWVETPFPLVKAMRLVYRGGPVPPPEPAPKVLYPRPALAKDWYKGVSRKIHGDFHNAGFIHGIGKNFDVEEYGRTLEQAGVNAIVVFGKSREGYTYYNTRVGTRHPGLDFDLLAKQIEACHKRNIQVWAYLCVGEEELFSTTLEQKLAKPNSYSIKIKPEVGGAYEKYELMPMIRELVCNYDLDGLYIDFPEVEAFIHKTTKVVKALRPGTVIAFNHQWSKSRSEQAALDIDELESWDHKMAFYHWQYFARYLRGSVPLTAMPIRFWRTWGDFGGLTDEANLRFQVATGQANGCLITVGDHLHPYGRLDPAIYDRIGRVMRDARTIEPYVIDSESVPYVALLRPKTVKLCGVDADCHALIDSAIHFTVLDPMQDLAPFKAVVAADASKLSDDQVGKLDRYIADGGRLILMGKPSESLAGLAGVRLNATPEAAYIRIDPKILPTPPAMDIFTYSEVLPAEPLEGTQVLAPLVWQLEHGTRYSSRHQSPPDDKISGLAAITACRHGKGQVVYVAAPIIDTYASLGYTAMREILADLIDYAIPPAERLADVRAPVPLEVSVNRLGDKLIVHLVHCPQSRLSASAWNQDDYANHQPIVQGMPTVSGVKLSMPADLLKGRKVRLLTGQGDLQPSVTGGVATMTIPDFQIRAVLVIE